jgi:hypothetical protein
MYGNVFITFLYYCLMLYFFVRPLIFLRKRAVLECTTLHTFQHAISYAPQYFSVECCVLQSLSVVYFFYYCCNVLLLSIKHNCFVNNNYY